MRGAGTVLLWLCASCYAPAPQPGAPCSDGVCPSGLVCATATQTCELRESTGVDASTSNDADDASVLRDASLIGLDATADAQTCFGDGMLRVCLTAPPTAPLTITSNTTIDTNTSPLCVGYSGMLEGELCVVAATNVSISDKRKLTGSGSKPLVVIASDTILVDGTIDMAGGAGANPSTCVAPTSATNRQGGAGGSGQGRGGSGGGTETGLGPASAAATTTVALRGGCRGGNGAGNSPGSGGSGGGALYLIGSTITINGTLDASGNGGGAATNAGGGGGGGAGGFIGLDAPTLTISSSGRVYANGGGGGEGGTPYKDGYGGSTSGGPTSAASGGSGGANHGGNGGSGSSGTSLTGNNGSGGGTCRRDGESGGGGGGGAGFIYVYPARALSNVAPPPS